MKDVKKLFKNLKHKYLGIGLLLVLCNVSLLGVGFSSWVMTGGVSTEANINVEVGDIVQDNIYGESISYIIGSEKLPSYYCYDNKYELINAIFSLKIKIRPDLVKSMFNGQEVEAYFGLECIKQANNYFDDTVSGFVIPNFYTCYVENIDNCYLNSNALEIKSEQSSIKIGANILVYSDKKPSLYSICNYYQSNMNYVYFDVKFELGIKKELIVDTTLLTSSFCFYTSIGGVEK